MINLNQINDFIRQWMFDEVIFPIDYDDYEDGVYYSSEYPLHITKDESDKISFFIVLYKWHDSINGLIQKKVEFSLLNNDFIIIETQKCDEFLNNVTKDLLKNDIMKTHLIPFITRVFRDSQINTLLQD